MEDENLTVEQVAEILKVSRQTIWIRCKRGQLPAFKLPGSRRWLISRKDLDRLQKELKKNKYENK
ncbi:MAG: hypothetical protein ACD_51C00361G0008 [uncultured bacterium]|nr:MAG: hypothetical protein ACD_51C00361G0008 [uncultured bacterium]OGH14222.1 MAG: hypothetical protein A2687_05865 [Candidatus Levybacteria bacterium RIFCSPHIGHO2_01_FULL_38_26]